MKVKCATELIKDIVNVLNTFSVEYAYFDISDKYFRFKMPFANDIYYTLDVLNKPTNEWQDLYRTESLEDIREYIKAIK